jgi:thiosulfate/3-mercaptopyruvate sulfurtransferase
MSEINWKFPEYISSFEWLNNNLDNKKVRIFDCTTYLLYQDDDPSLPYIVESGFREYQISHIKNSAYLDLQKDLSDNSSKFRFTLPDYHTLAKNFSNLGVGDDFHIVLYSRNGLQWATRIWWMLYVLGFKNLSILDGSFNEWKKNNLPTESKINIFEKSEFKIEINNKIFVDKNRVLGSMNTKECVILNSLTEDLHNGENPRYGRPGRIPGSLNIPFHELTDLEKGCFKSPSECLEVFKKKGISQDSRVLNYCGGGIAASLDAFVLFQLGYDDIEIYDNSMSEWATDENLPIEIG